MVRTKLGSLMLAAACCAAILAVPQIAAAQSSTFIIPFSRTGAPGVDANGLPTGAFVNPCTLEFVDVTGSSTITTTQSLKGSTLSTSVSVVTKGSGFGWLDGDLDPLTPVVYPGVITGSSYVFNESQSFTIKSQLGTVVESDFFDKLFMKGAKSTDNWVVRARFRLKIGANGQVQIDLIRINDGDQCKG